MDLNGLLPNGLAPQPGGPPVTARGRATECGVRGPVAAATVGLALRPLPMSGLAVPAGSGWAAGPG
jgi:hypothetical protein